MTHPRADRIALMAGVAATAAFTAYAVHANTQSHAPLPTVATLDLQRYVGHWYEIARMPSWFQRKCVGQAEAHYTARPDDRFTVHNSCGTANGEVTQAEGVGESFSPEHPGRLRVSFTPQWVRSIGIGWGDYWVIALDNDYRWSLVGTPDRKYLWILARTRTLDAQTLEKLTGQARKLGFPVDSLEFPQPSGANGSNTPKQIQPASQ
jgi:apolipoprotein D and lipocalin family protein